MMHELGTTRHLGPNETLFSAGEDSDTVYFVTAGLLDVLHRSTEGELVVATLGVGEVIGEITAVIGGHRTATVRAGADPVTLQELTAHEYGTWLSDKPAEAQRIAELARDRIDKMRVARVLTDLIGIGHNDVIDDFNELLEWTRLEAGQQLFAQDDVADAAYIVVTGRLQLTAVHDGKTTLNVSVGRGDIVGELGIIEQAPRSASATATRDTTLAKLSESAFERLTGQYPKLMLEVFRKVLTRVMQPNHRSPHAGMIAVAILSPAAEPDLVRMMCNEIQGHGPTLYLDREQVSRFFNRRGVVDADPGSAEHARLDEFLNEADVAHRWVVLEADPTLTTWSSRAIRSADRVLLITSPFPDEREHHLIREFTKTVDAIIDRELWIVQSNQASIDRPVANKSVIEATSPERILQHRRGDASSTARLGRLASGTATGVAMSGGGGRAFGQIGAVRALTEAGINIDVLTGTSMGSIVAAMMAFVADPDGLAEQVEKCFSGAKIIDYTLPLVSLTMGKGLTAAIERGCGPLLIEELTLPFSCLSTNLTSAQLVEHRRGLLSHALRSSVSLPGIFPPVVVDGDLLVDGGVMENLPVGPLVRDPAVNRVVAIDVAAPDGPSSHVAYGGGLSGRRALRGLFSRRRSSYPGIINTVMASMLLSSSRARHDALAQDHIDIYLSLNLKGVKLLDFDAIPAVADRGYEATIERLEAMDLA
jgi:predicted acylesterase/phospholipase RssA/CRP-like cAMP-binding protein